MKKRNPAILIFTDQKGSSSGGEGAIVKIARHYAFVEKELLGLEDIANICVIKTIGDSLMIRIDHNNWGNHIKVSEVILEILRALTEAQSKLKDETINPALKHVVIRFVCYLCDDFIEEKEFAKLLKDERRAVHSKSEIISQHQNDMYGPSVVMSARLESIAANDQVLISENLYERLFPPKKKRAISNIGSWKITQAPGDNKIITVSRDNNVLFFLHPFTPLGHLKGSEKLLSVIEVFKESEKYRELKKERFLATIQSIKCLTTISPGGIPAQNLLELFRLKDTSQSMVLGGIPIKDDKKEDKDTAAELVTFWSFPEFKVYKMTIDKVVRKYPEIIPRSHILYAIVGVNEDTILVKGNTCLLVLLKVKNFQDSKMLAEIVSAGFSSYSDTETTLIQYGLVMGEWDNYFLYKIANPDKTLYKKIRKEYIDELANAYAEGKKWCENTNLRFIPFSIDLIQSDRIKYWCPEEVS